MQRRQPWIWRWYLPPLPAGHSRQRHTRLERRGGMRALRAWHVQFRPRSIELCDMPSRPLLRRRLGPRCQGPARARADDRHHTDAHALSCRHLQPGDRQWLARGLCRMRARLRRPEHRRHFDRCMRAVCARLLAAPPGDGRLCSVCALAGAAIGRPALVRTVRAWHVFGCRRRDQLLALQAGLAHAPSIRCEP